MENPTDRLAVVFFQTFATFLTMSCSETRTELLPKRYRRRSSTEQLTTSGDKTRGCDPLFTTEVGFLFPGGIRVKARESEVLGGFIICGAKSPGNISAAPLGKESCVSYRSHPFRATIGRGELPDSWGVDLASDDDELGAYGGPILYGRPWYL